MQVHITFFIESVFHIKQNVGKMHIKGLPQESVKFLLLIYINLVNLTLEPLLKNVYSMFRICFRIL